MLGNELVAEASSVSDFGVKSGVVKTPAIRGAENEQLKQLVAELMLKKRVLKKVGRILRASGMHDTVLAA
jgi:hypothetical protein